MNDILWLVYLANVLGNLNSTICAFIAIGGAALGVAIFIHAVHYEKLLPKAARYATGLLIASLATVFLPSERTMLIVVGAKAGQVAIDTEVGQKAVRLLNKKLDEALGGKEKDK